MKSSDFHHRSTGTTDESGGVGSIGPQRLRCGRTIIRHRTPPYQQRIGTNRCRSPALPRDIEPCLSPANASSCLKAERRLLPEGRELLDLSKTTQPVKHSLWPNATAATRTLGARSASVKSMHVPSGGRSSILSTQRQYCSQCMRGTCLLEAARQYSALSASAPHWTLGV